MMYRSIVICKYERNVNVFIPQCYEICTMSDQLNSKMIVRQTYMTYYSLVHVYYKNTTLYIRLFITYTNASNGKLLLAK